MQPDAMRLFNWLLADHDPEEVVFTALNLENKGYSKRDRRTIGRFSNVTWQRSGPHDELMKGAYEHH